MKREELLQRSPYFCMLPWVHLHFWPDGRAFPCCIADSSKPIGQYGEKSIQEIWNSPRLKEIRQNMLEGRPSAECTRCYTLENAANIYTLRKNSNVGFANNWSQVESTRPDGSVPKLNMSYFDIRFSNLCNFRCQTCGPSLSSAWYEDQVKTFGDPGHQKVIRIHPNDAFWTELEPLLMDVQEAYFAGGEPLLSDEHYRILDFWLSRGKLDVQVSYTTNFSQLNFRGKNILEYWNKFPKTRISASLDAAGPRAEYLRKGTDWERIVQNRKDMIRACPQVYFEITPTISAYNVFHFPDFHLEWVDQGLLGINNLRLNQLTYPPSMAVHILPKSFKLEIVEKYRRVMDSLINRAIQLHQPYGQVQEGYQSVIQVLQAEDLSYEQNLQLWLTFFKRAVTVDNTRNENVFSVFPELGVLNA